MKVFLLLLMIISPVYLLEHKQNEGVNMMQKDTPYVANNCHEDIYVSSICSSCFPISPCYQSHPYGSHSYPEGGFCLMEDITHGLQPGVVSYTMVVNNTEYYATYAGFGIYFNYQDVNNFEVIYKIDFNSDICIVGYVEQGTVYNSTTFPCSEHSGCLYLISQVEVTSDMVFYTRYQSNTGEADNYSFQPHFPVVAKAGPLAVNSFYNYRFFSSDIILETKTCLDEPTSPLCDQCNLAFNIQTNPEYPLPNYRNLMLWHSRAMEMVYSACYVKVVINLPGEHVVTVASKVGQFSHTSQGSEEEDIKPGDLYGQRNQCTENMTACVEVKYGGSVTDGDIQYLDKTLVEMRLDNSTTLTSSQVNHNLELLYNEDIVRHTPHEFHMYIQEHVYGAEFGIYCYTVKGSAFVAKNSAYNMCAAGNNDALQPPPESINQDNWAVRFS